MSRISRFGVVFWLTVWTVVLLGIMSSAWSKESQDKNPGYRICKMEKLFEEIRNKELSGKITRRQRLMQEARVFYEGDGPAILKKCDEDTQALLKNELVEEVYRVRCHLNEADKLHLRSLDPELVEALDRPSLAERQAMGENDDSQEIPKNAWQKIRDAYDEGRISKKEAVFLKIKLMYAPQLIPSDSEFAPRPEDEPEPLRMDGGIYEDLDGIMDQLRDDEKEWLKSLDPGLKNSILGWEQASMFEANRRPLAKELPDYPNLNMTYDKGNHCIVHYTQTKGDPDCVANVEYVAEIAKNYDRAVETMNATGQFRKAYAAGDGKKMHIYCRLSPTAVAWRVWKAVEGNGNRRAGYIQVHNKLKNSDVKKGAMYHEYFHGIQSAYNHYLSSWFKEASAVWAAAVYGQFYSYIKYVNDQKDSIFNKPNDNIWVYDQSKWRHYSIATLVFFLSHKYGNPGIVRSILEKSFDTNDAILCIRKCTSSFSTDFREYFAALYAGNIDGIEEHMPRMKIEDTHNEYGVKSTGKVKLLGANYYNLNVPDRRKLRDSPMISTIKKTGKGRPEGFLVEKSKNKKEMKPAPVVQGVSHITKADKGAVLIVCDLDYDGEDSSFRPYEYSVVTPYFHLLKTEAVSPIRLDEISAITHTYDLLGIVKGEGFQGTFELVEYRASNGYKFPLPPPDSRCFWDGESVFHRWYFGASYGDATYEFKYEFRIPSDEWKEVFEVPQKKTSGWVTIKVVD